MDKPNFESVQTDIMNGWRFSKVVQCGLPFSRAPKCPEFSLSVPVGLTSQLATIYLYTTDLPVNAM